MRLLSLLLLLTKQKKMKKHNEIGNAFFSHHSSLFFLLNGTFLVLDRPSLMVMLLMFFLGTTKLVVCFSIFIIIPVVGNVIHQIGLPYLEMFLVANIKRRIELQQPVHIIEQRSTRAVLEFQLHKIQKKMSHLKWIIVL